VVIPYPPATLPQRVPRESFVEVEGDGASHSEFTSAELRFPQNGIFVTRVTPQEEFT